MNDSSEFPASIRARVHDGAIDRVTRFFNATLADAFVELVQNSRRAGATRMDVVTEALPEAGASSGIRVTVTDDGNGIADPAVLLSFGESGWDEDTARREDPAGIGVYALSKRGCTVSSRARGPLLDLAPGWRVVLTPDCFLGKEEAAVAEADAPWPHGTAISFMADESLVMIQGAIAAAARHCPLPVTFNGEQVERKAFLDGALHAERWRGLTFGVFRNRLTGYNTPDLNFHGLTLAVRLPTVDPIEGGTWSAHADIDACPELELVLPARKEAVESPFIATIARRLDSLGAITRGQRDSQTAMGGGDAALFRASDNLESPYARSALRQFYIALWRGHIEGWSLADFEEATGLKLTWEGSLKEQLPPMPQFLNRLLALPIDEQNVLFAALETRIEANIEQAIEAGTFERGVETIAADSLAVASRETVFVHEGSGADTEIVEIARKDRLEPLTADAALSLHAAGSSGKPRLMVNAQSKRAALILPAPSRMFDDGGVQERVRLVRPAARDTIARDALDVSQWREAHEDRWRAFWDSEVAGLPAHTESRFWLVAGLLLPIWDRLPEESMRVRRLVTDAGEHLIGRVLGPAEAAAFHAAFGLAGGPSLTPAETVDEIMVRGATFHLANGWRLARRRLMGADRIEIEGPADGDTDALKRMGCIAEIVSWRTRLFAPDTATLERVVERWPLAAPDA